MVVIAMIVRQISKMWHTYPSQKIAQGIWQQPLQN